jgi:hypothetical protein
MRNTDVMARAGFLGAVVIALSIPSMFGGIVHRSDRTIAISLQRVDSVPSEGIGSPGSGIIRSVCTAAAYARTTLDIRTDDDRITTIRVAPKVVEFTPVGFDDDVGTCTWRVNLSVTVPGSRRYEAQASDTDRLGDRASSRGVSISAPSLKANGDRWSLVWGPTVFALTSEGGSDSG